MTPTKEQWREYHYGIKKAAPPKKKVTQWKVVDDYGNSYGFGIYAFCKTIQKKLTTKTKIVPCN